MLSAISSMYSTLSLKSAGISSCIIPLLTAFTPDDFCTCWYAILEQINLAFGKSTNADIWSA